MTPLSALILDVLQREHVGMASAIQRRDLLRWLRERGVETTDRKMRYAIKEIPGAACGPHGYFIPANSDEVRATVRYLEKKIYPLWDDIQALRRAYPDISQLEIEWRG